MSFEFQATQKSFASRIRHGNASPIPEGISLERMQVYEQCFFNGINELLGNCFPIFANAIPTEKWRKLVIEFYAKHPCQSPFFYEIPQNFVVFLMQNEALWQTEYPFLMELAHYEWMEMVIEMSEAESPLPMITQEIDYDHTIYAVSETAEIVAYHYPVHQISAEFLPKTADQQPTFFCIYRNSKDVVKSLELNALSARFLQCLKNTPQTLKQAVEEITTTKNNKQIEKVIINNENLIRNLRVQGIVYSVQN